MRGGVVFVVVCCEKKTGYEMSACVVGSEMCRRGRCLEGVIVRVIFGGGLVWGGLEGAVVVVGLKVVVVMR